jgi:hypothetical protein
MRKSLAAILTSAVVRCAAVLSIASATAPAFAQSGAASGAVRVTAEIESDRVYVGQPFELQVSVEGDTRSQPPEVPALDGFHIEQRGSSTNSEIVFDGTRTVERTRRVFQYSLTPTRLGVLTIPPIEVRTREGVKRTEQLRVTVEEPGEMDDFKLRLEVSDQDVYAGEPVTLRLTWFIGAEVQKAAFSMPALPDGFRLYSSADRGLTPAHFQSGQFFEVNFLGERSVARAGAAELDGRRFSTLTIEKLIVPTAPGEYELGPATVAFSQATRGRRSIFDSPFFNQGRSSTEVVASEPVTLVVLPLPTIGRPASFSGLVGEYTVEAEAEPLEVRVGDPITLRVTVMGSGPAEEIPTLDLSGQPGFEDAFKLTGERPTVELVQDGKRFTTMIRARNESVSAIPSLELTYFDAKAGEYRTASSDPIPLRVLTAPRVELPGDAGDPSLDRDRAVARRDAPSGPREVVIEDLAPSGEGLFALVRGPVGVAAVAIPPVAALAIVAIGAVRRRSTADPLRGRKHRALREANRALECHDGAEGVLLAVRGFAADWSGRSREAITADEAVEFLERSGVRHARAVRDAVDACAAAEFGGATADDVSGARSTVRESLAKMDHDLRAKKGSSQ